MKKLFLLVTIFLSICALQAFSQTDVAANAIIQKKHKVFVRADFAGFNLSFYPQNSYEGGLYSGVHTSCTAGYCVSNQVRLGVGGEAMAEGNIGSGNGLPGYNSLQVYASFEYGDHSKKVSPFYDFNAGYAFLSIGQNSLNDENYASFSNGPFVEFLPGISFGSKQSPNRWRIGLGNQLQFTTVSYRDDVYPGPLQGATSGRYNAATGVYSYNSYIMRMVFEVGVDF